MKANTFGVVTCLWNKLMKLLKEKTKGIQEVTWQELKDLRDDNNLVKGRLYRITDYECTTTQTDTRSAGHQFDIVLLALSENTLSEEGWAMEHPTDVYDVTFSDGVTKKCYIYMAGKLSANVVDCETLLGYSVSDMEKEGLTINNENKTANWTHARPTKLDTVGLTYNYFQNSNLSAWKVWYCLDNDKSRFSWADDSVDESVAESITYYYGRTDTFIYERNPSIDVVGYYGWSCNENSAPTQNLYTETLTIIPGTTKATDFPTVRPGYNIGRYTPAHEGTNLPNGRGVIYRLIDEWNNDIAYDFKNIQFSRKLTEYGEYDPSDGRKRYVYTFNWYNDSGISEDASIVGNYSLTDDQGRIAGVVNNTIKSRVKWDDSISSGQRAPQALNDIVFLGNYHYEGYIFYPIMGNTFDHNCMDVTGGMYCLYNQFSSACSMVTMGTECICNTILSGANNLTITPGTSNKCYIAGKLINE